MRESPRGTGGVAETRRVLTKVLYGEAPPRGPIPYPLVYRISFFKKVALFVYLAFTNQTFFTYLRSLELCMPFNHC